MVVAPLVLSVVAAYLLGSIPTGLWLSRRLTGQDIRQLGSGNTGATNVLRTVGWRAALPVVVFDVGKGLVAVLLGRLLAAVFGLDPELRPLTDSLTAFAAIAGHNWPLYAGFRGGRGVATGFGTLIAISPTVALVTILLGAVIIVGTDTVSAGSLGGALIAVLLMSGFGDHRYLPYVIVSAIVVVLQHRGNIYRLVHGTERRLGVRDKLLGRFLPRGW